MKLKFIFRKAFLWIVNLLYYPNFLGYWSDNNTGGYVITNKDCTKYRAFGHPTWANWDNNPPYPRVHNEHLKVAKIEDMDHTGLWYLLQKDHKNINLIIDRLLGYIQTILLIVFLVNFFTKSMIVNNIFMTIFMITTFFRLITITIKYNKLRSKDD